MPEQTSIEDEQIIDSLIGQRDVGYAQRDEACAKVKDLETEIRRLHQLLTMQHEGITQALEHSRNMLVYARDGGVNPS